MWLQYLLLLTLLLLTPDLWVKVTVADMPVPYNSVSDSKDGSSNEKTFQISTQDSNRVKHVAAIIEAFEKLEILNPNQKNCYSLEKIVRRTEHDEEGNWRIAIFLHVHDLDKRPQEMVTSAANADHVTTDGVTVSPQESTTAPSPKTNTGQSDECIFKAAAGATKPQTNFSKTNRSVAGTGKEKETVDESAGNRTSSEVTKEKHEETDGGPRLSRTQVLVISTCSTVIGVFFIVAVMMRIRNYINRVREEQAAARRPSFRGSAIGLRSNSNQGKDGRLEAALNKASDSVAMATTRKDADEELDGTMSSKYGNQENRPLLIVTAASTPSSPCPQRALYDYQYSNRDDDDVMTADEQGCHDVPRFPERHDIYGAPFMNGKDVNDVASNVPSVPRRKPLKSCIKQRDRTRQPYNGGVMTCVQPKVTESEFMTSCVQEADDNVGVSSVVKPPGILKHIGGDYTGLTRCDSSGSEKSRCVAPLREKNIPERLLDFGECQEGTRYEEQDDPECLDAPGCHIQERESYQTRELDIEYEFRNGGVVRTAEVLYPQATNQPRETDIDGDIITGTGFTQSDSSISSTNPSYRYGNQVEYTGVYQYGNTVYFPDETESSGTVEASDDEPDEKVEQHNIMTSSRPTYVSHNSDDTAPSGRRMSSDSLTYNESPRRLASQRGQPRDSSDESPDWLDESLHENNTFTYEDERTTCNPERGVREDRLPYIKECDDEIPSDTEIKYSIAVSKDIGGLNVGSDVIHKRAADVTPKSSISVKRNRRLQRNAATIDAEEATRFEERNPDCNHIDQEEVSSDTEVCENISTTLLLPKDAKKRKTDSNGGCSEWSFLLDPAFEGMEPTYV